MTKAETVQIIAVLQVNYPDNFKDKSDAMVKATVDLWTRAFEDDDYSVVSAAVMAHIVTDTNRFMPPIGVIKAKITELMKREEMTEQEAWSLVAKALGNSTYGSAEEYAKLPPAVKRAVGSPTQLREWAMMDTDTVQSVVASNFQRSYRAISQRECDWEKLPASLRTYVEGIAENSFGRLDAPKLGIMDAERAKQDAIRKLREAK